MLILNMWCCSGKKERESRNSWRQSSLSFLLLLMKLCWVFRPFHGGNHEIIETSPYFLTLSRRHFFTHEQTCSNSFSFPRFLSNGTIMVQKDQMEREDNNAAGAGAHHRNAEIQTQTDLLSADLTAARWEWMYEIKWISWIAGSGLKPGWEIWFGLWPYTE